MAKSNGVKNGYWDRIKDIPAFLVALISLISIVIAALGAGYAYFAKQTELEYVDCLSQRYRVLAGLFDKEHDDKINLTRKILELNIIINKKELLGYIDPPKSLSIQEQEVEKTLRYELPIIQKEIADRRKNINKLIESGFLRPKLVTSECKSSI